MQTQIAPETNRPAAPALALLSAEEGSELGSLREALRERHSVDSLARAWYGGLLGILFTGILIKVFHDTGKMPARSTAALVLLVGLAAASVCAWSFCAAHLLQGRARFIGEQKKLTRLRALEVRSPKTPELF